MLASKIIHLSNLRCILDLLATIDRVIDSQHAMIGTDNIIRHVISDVNGQGKEKIIRGTICDNLNEKI